MPERSALTDWHQRFRNAFWNRSDAWSLVDATLPTAHGVLRGAILGCRAELLYEAGPTAAAEGSANVDEAFPLVSGFPGEEARLALRGSALCFRAHLPRRMTRYQRAIARLLMDPHPDVVAFTGDLLVAHAQGAMITGEWTVAERRLSAALAWYRTSVGDQGRAVHAYREALAYLNVAMVRLRQRRISGSSHALARAEALMPSWGHPDTALLEVRAEIALARRQWDEARVAAEALSARGTGAAVVGAALISRIAAASGHTTESLRFRDAALARAAALGAWGQVRTLSAFADPHTIQRDPREKPAPPQSFQSAAQ